MPMRPSQKTEVHGQNTWICTGSDALDRHLGSARLPIGLCVCVSLMSQITDKMINVRHKFKAVTFCLMLFYIAVSALCQT